MRDVQYPSTGQHRCGRDGLSMPSTKKAGEHGALRLLHAISQQSSTGERKKMIVSNDHMILHLDVEESAGRHQLAGDGNVSIARLGLATGVIMRTDDGV